jgi:hypothetical protein
VTERGDRLLFGPTGCGRHPLRAKSTLSPFSVAVVACLVCACPDKTHEPADERLIAKLKAEKAREAKEGAMVPPTAVAPPPEEKVNPLAEFAAKGTQVRELKVPEKNVFGLHHQVLRLAKLQAMHTVGEGISVTTEDWFLKCTFQEEGPKGTYVDFGATHLERDGQQFAFARDAQAASKQQALIPLGEGPVTVTAFFEVPDEALRPGLTLVVPDGEGKDPAKLELQ